LATSNLTYQKARHDPTNTTNPDDASSDFMPMQRRERACYDGGKCDDKGAYLTSACFM
jgi:hypothetical protein